VVICVKTADPMKMPFELWAQIGRRNNVLDGGPEMLNDVAMVTNSGTQFAITGFVGYSFGCMMASDMLFESKGGLPGSGYPINTQPRLTV